jgi:hypothetical protein
MEAKKRRLGKKVVRVLAWGSGAVAFGLPWAAFQLLPATATATAAQAPPAQQTITVPAGSQVVVTTSANGTTGIQVIKSKGVASTTHAPIATTRASAPPVP